MAFRKTCFPPSALVTSDAASQFGLIAERFIGADYLATFGRRSFFPTSLIDFQDISIGFGNVVLLISFLGANNPHLSKTQLAALSAQFGLVKVPDLMSHDPPRQTEFYEIKPNSPSGLLEGTAKVALLSALMSFSSLPYLPGTIYSPSAKRILLFGGIIFGKSLFVRFVFSRIGPGLIVYYICCDGDLVESVATVHHRIPGHGRPGRRAGREATAEIAESECARGKIRTDDQAILSGPDDSVWREVVTDSHFELRRP